ncbi:MAG: hypothetical protein ABFS32_13015 [Bacteroidota bacterium]
MDKEEFKKIVDNPNFIQGIFNYCDRWCERCHMTHKCSLYATEKESIGDEEIDMQNEKFWEHLSDMFRITRELIEESAEKWGIDLDSIDLDEENTEYEELHEKTEKHSLSILGKEYTQKARQWHDSSEVILQAKEDEYNKNLELGIEDKEIKELIDVLEVVRWYQYQVHIKVNRALHGKLDSFEEDDEFPKDSDGSAKVALIGMDRSIAAWGKLLEYFPENEDKTLELLVILEKLRRQVEKEFPEARAFVRVGFDE